MAVYTNAIGGRVTDNLGNPVENAKITLLDSNDDSVVSIARSDVDGYYVFENLGAGNTYHAVCEYEADGRYYRSFSAPFMQPEATFEIEIPLHAIYGAWWGKVQQPSLTRIGAATGMAANAGIDGTMPQNDFDSTPIWGQIAEVTDDYGNVFMRIPKFHIRKLDTVDGRTWEVSLHKHSDFYLPWCFWDFNNSEELPYVDVGKYHASLDDGSRLASKPARSPLVSKSIVDFRNYAMANNVGGLLGYQQMDIHIWDMLQTLFFVEFATLDSQSIMAGYTDRQSADLAQSGFSTYIAASSGSVNSNSNGKFPMMYRGIECLWGNVAQFIDGVNTSAFQAWVALDATLYASDVFTKPYYPLSYQFTGYGDIKHVGMDSDLPFASLPTELYNSILSYYYTDTWHVGEGETGRVLWGGGNKNSLDRGGINRMGANLSSTVGTALTGGRLCRKATGSGM